MADPDDWTLMAVAGCAKLVVFFAVVAVVVCVLYIFVWCRLSRRIRIFRLGGITTLERTLNYGYTLCQYSMEAGEKVRTLSCDHVFHCGGTDKCEDGIDVWLRKAPEMVCPLCRQSPHPVEPSKRPPQSSPSQSASTSTQDLKAPLLSPAHDQEASSSEARAPPPAQSPPTSTPDLVEIRVIKLGWDCVHASCGAVWNWISSW